MGYPQYLAAAKPDGLQTLGQQQPGGADYRRPSTTNQRQDLFEI